MKKVILSILTLVFIGLNALLTQSGGSFTIEKSVIAGGGERSSGGAFTLDGTIGQPLAGTILTGGSFNLSSGFWGYSTNNQAAIRALFDFDGDSKTDIAIFRPPVGEWWCQRSSDGQVPAAQFGVSTDKIVPGDFTGDGRSDIAFWRPSNGFWFILRSENFSFYSVPFGASGDIPAPGDYDGDGKFDATVFRPSNSTWFIQRTQAGTAIVTFGINSDIPVPSAFVG